MSTLGRNGPCHCGSGKKYKKCCMEADEKKRMQVPIATNETINAEDEEEIYPDEEPIITSDSEINNEYKDTPETITGLPFPKISKEDDAFLDEWYENLEHIEKPIDQLNFAIQFREEHSQLVPAWGFEGEHLLDLISECYKEGYGEEIFNFLVSFRNRFPGVYQREFGYLDCTLIYHSLIQDKKPDILLFLDNFEKYPDAFPDKLFEMVNILSIKGEAGLLFPFLKKIHQQVVHSEKIIGGNDILAPLLLYIEGKYIRPGLPDNEYTRLCNEIRETMKVEINDKFQVPEYWKKQHAAIYAEPGIFSCNLNKKDERDEAYRTIVKQFIRYLYEDIIHDWTSANMIGYDLADYLFYTIKTSKVKKRNYFVLDKSVLDNYIAQKLKRYFWIDAYRTNSLLTAIWYFAPFLVKTGNAQQQDIVKIQDTCLEFHKLEQKINKGNIDSAVFNKFPIH